MTEDLKTAGGFGATQPPPKEPAPATKPKPAAKAPAPAKPLPTNTNAPTGKAPDKPTAANVPGVFNVIREAQRTGATFNAPVKPNEYSFWEDPKRVVRYRNMLRSAPPEFEAPEWIDRDQVEEAYQYMKFRNNDKPVEDWQFLADNDPGSSFLRGMPAPPPAFQPAYDRDWTKQTAPEAAAPKPPELDWDNLNLWQQITLGILVPGDPSDPMSGRPWTSRASAAGMHGIIAALPAAGAGAFLGGPVGAGLAAGAVGIGTAYQAYTGNEVPVLSQMLTALDILSMGANRAIGMVGQIGDQGLVTIMGDLPNAWAAAQLNHIVSPMDPTNLIAMLAGDEAAGADEVWQLEKGFSEPQKLAAGEFGAVRGAQAMHEARIRLGRGEDLLAVMTDIQSRFGTTGTISDFVYGSLIDPAPLLPNIGGRAGSRIAKATSHNRLAAALTEGVGNPAADMLSNVPILGSLANKALGIRPSDGLIQSMEKYKNWIQTGYSPDGTPVPAASSLSSFEKWAGGLDEQGKIKELQPNERKGMLNYLNNLTPEAQAHAFMSMAHDNLNVILSMADSDPRKMVQLLRQAAGVDPVAVAEVGKAILDSPVTVTVAQALRDVVGDNWDQDLLLRWEETTQHRTMLEKTARALNEKAGAILDQYRDNPEALMRRITEAGGPAGDPAQLRAVFEVFTGEDTQPWNANQFQAKLAITMFDKMDQAIAKRYNLKPDAPVFRLSQTLKGMQSLLLLGFNPSYFINNQVNNMVTRAATGVFGYMTPRQIGEFTERFGITPDRMRDALDASGQPAGRDPIANARKANDWIAKAHGAVSATNRKLGIFSKFSSAGERLESSNAYAIGMQKFFGRAWKRGKGLRKMHPAVETALDRAAPGVKDLIYQAVEAGMNMQEIEAAVFGETLRPQINSVIDQAARSLFPDDPTRGVELLQATGIQANLERQLASATTPDEARTAFRRVEQDLRNIVNENMKREIATRAEDVANRVTSEGAPAILAELVGLADRITRRTGANADSFSRVSAHAAQTFAGILQATGRGNDQAKKITAEITKANRNLKKFEADRSKLVRQLAKEKDTAVQTRIRGEIEGLHKEYVTQLEASAARIQTITQARATPPPPANTAAEPQTQALYQLATEYSMVDREGRPVLRYLMNVVNRYQPDGKKYTSPESVPLEQARETLARHAQRLAAQPDQTALDYDQIIKLADRDARQAELEANGMMTRRLMREQLAEAFGANDAEVAAAMTILDYHADQVARQANQTPTEASRDAWYATRIAQVIKNGGDATAYNNYYQEQYGSLTAIHNMSAAKLLDADKLGGLPAPSIAILRARESYTEFGEISLIGRRDQIDPQQWRKNRVFDSDIYSPRRPAQVWKKVKSKQADPLFKQFRPLTNELGGWFTERLHEFMIDHPDRNKLLEQFEQHAEPMVAFLRERGYTITPRIKQVSVKYEFVTDAAVREWMIENVQTLTDIARQDGTTARSAHPLYAEFHEVARDAIIRANGTALGTAEWNNLIGPDGRLSSYRFDQIANDFHVTKAGPSPDVYRTRTDAEHLLETANLKNEYSIWARNLVDSIYEPPLLKLKGKLVPYTLFNVLDAMDVKQIRGAEEGMTFGPARVRAMVAKEFDSIDAMHRAEGNLVSDVDFEGAKARQKEILDDYQQRILDYAETNQLSTWGTLDDSMRVLYDYLKGGKKRSTQRMEQALKRYRFDPLEMHVDDIEFAIDAAEAIINMPTEYFEAKPNRVVHFDEFAGAVVPDDASPEVFETLQRRGIEYRTYKSDDPTARQKAVEEFYATEGVLFQGIHQGVKGQATMPREMLVENARKIKELGFISPEAVAPVFAGATPAYIKEIARFIMERRERYTQGKMTVRDVAKSYLITVSSQGSDALPIDTVLASFERAGLKLERAGVPMDLTRYTHPEARKAKGKGKGETLVHMIRPEEVAGLWLLSDQGKAALDALERGEITDAWLTYVEGRTPFGRFGGGRKFTEVDGKRVYTELPGEWFVKKGARGKFNLADIQKVTDQLNAAKGDPDLMRKAVTGLAGIAEGKAGFLKHMIGFADETTFDTQQANFWKAYLGQAGFDAKLTETLDWGNWGQPGVIGQFKEMVTDVYYQLREQGVAADIPEEAFVHIMHHWLWDYQKGKESPHTAMYEALRLAQQAKGSVNFLRDGRAVIRALESPDITTMMHEVGHIFRRDLSEADLDAVAKIGGLENGAELKDLQARFMRGEIMPSDPEYARYVEAEEYFARGWERYLIEGDAPTPELRTVFQNFTTWMLKVYTSLRQQWDQWKGEKVNYFQRQQEFNVGGRAVDIRARIDGRSLRDIFDDLLVEQRQDSDDAYTPVEQAPLQTDADLPPNVRAFQNKPSKELPAAVRQDMTNIAQRLLDEIGEVQNLVLKGETLEGGAVTDTVTRAWEGPDWYKQLYNSEVEQFNKKAAGGLKGEIEAELKAVVKGRSNGRTKRASLVRDLIRERAMSTNVGEAVSAPGLLRYLGENDTLFENYADMILSSEAPALERVFGDDADAVVDDLLLWLGDRDSSGDDAQLFGTEQADIENVPVDSLAQTAAADAAAETERQRQADQDASLMQESPEPETDLFGNPVGGFNLEGQEAQPDLFNPQTQGEQGSLFDRREYMKTIEGKKAKDSAAPLGTKDQPALFQGAEVPPGGTPAPEPYGSTLDEVMFEQVQPLLRAVEAQYTAGLAQRKVKVGDLDEAGQQSIRDYMHQVRGDLASTKYAAMSYGQQMRDSALLNYNRRYGFDQVMDIVFPYQFWYTRSMVEWAKRMIDKPGWFAMYARLQEAQERTEANLPDRLRGKMRLPAPWLPEWAGGGLWFDPMGKFFPFSSFGQPMEQYANNVNRQQKSAEYILKDWTEADRITPAEARQAAEDKAGPIWDRAMKQAEVDSGTSANPAGFASLMMSPSLFWTAGKNILAGTPEKISTLPITRTAAAVETATKGTALEPMGQLAGLAAWPERAARKAAGLNEFGEWGDWYIDRQLANMAAEGVASAQQATTAMIEREGNPLYEEARQRVRYEQMLQVPGGAFLNQAAQGDIDGMLAATPTLIFNGSLFPEGELKLRGLSEEFSKAMQARDEGDDQAVNKFFAENPEYETRLALNDEPKERLRQFMVSEIWERYMNLERPNRSLAADQMGSQFRDAFLNKETRSYESISIETMARWTQMLGGLVPETPESAPAIQSPEPPAELYAPGLAAGIMEYQDERKAKFPNYYAQQTAYYNVPKTDKAGRKRILARFPELKQYWDWKGQQEKARPELADYFDGVVAERARTRGSGLTQQEIQKLDPILLRQVLAAEVANQPLTPGGHEMLRKLAEKKGMTAQEYQQMIISSLIPPVTQ